MRHGRGMSALDHRTLQLLATQHGVVGRFQLLGTHTRGEVDSLVTRRGLVPIERGIYAVRGAPETPEREAMAAQLRCRPRARLTGGFVLAQLGLEPFRRHDPFEVLVDPDRSVSAVTFPHRTDPRPGRRLTPIGALRCVHPTIALADGLVHLGERDRRVAFHVLRRRGLWSDRELAAELVARGDRDEGLRLLCELVDAGETVLDSAEESELGRRLRRIDPRFEPQVWITERYRVDWFLRWLRLAFEYQGEVDHGWAAGRAADAVKTGEAERVGVSVVPVVAADVRDPGFDDWVAGLIAARRYELQRLAR